MNRLMLDLETLGVRPGCVILSIGAVKFDVHWLGERFYRNIDMQSCTDAGLEIDSSTLDWWLGQEADYVLQGGEKIDKVLSDFSSFYNTDEIWANSPAFDCVILRAAYEQLDMEAPWHYSDERCFRTLRKLPQFVSTEMHGTKHDALDDAVHQAEGAAKTLKKLTR